MTVRRRSRRCTAAHVSNRASHRFGARGRARRSRTHASAAPSQVAEVVTARWACRRRRQPRGGGACGRRPKETGIDGLRLVVPAIHLDVHRVEPRNEAPHLHYDVRYLVLAPEGAKAIGNFESTALRWVTLDELDALTDEPGLRVLAAARARPRCATLDRVATAAFASRSQRGRGRDSLDNVGRAWRSSASCCGRRTHPWPCVICWHCAVAHRMSPPDSCRSAVEKSSRSTTY